MAGDGYESAYEGPPGSGSGCCGLDGEADADGSGELDIDEFCDKLGPYLGDVVGYELKSREQIRQLFMKIDADAGGTVDWDEFTNFMFLQRAQMVGESASENWRLFPQYVSCGRDGTFRLWNGSDCRHFKTIQLGSSWITDAIYMPNGRKLVFTTADRAISYYDANRGSFELTGRLYASGGMGVPQCLTLVTNEAGEQLVYGDSKGAAIMLLCGSREWPARDLISTDEHQVGDLTGHTASVSHIALDERLNHVFTLSVDKTIKGGGKGGAEAERGEGRFTRAHGDSRITAACFDRNERRLLTAANDGAVRMWNFNNGSLLRQYKHGEDPLEITAVDYAADEKRNVDSIYAAGWNCKVFVWDDIETSSGMVAEYRTFEGHREDITTIAALPSRQLLATGDYEGRINVYHLFTGERRTSLFHRAERYESSVERLVWIVPPFVCGMGRPRPASPAVAARAAGLGGLGGVGGAGGSSYDSDALWAGAGGAPVLLISFGGDGLMRVWLIGATGKLLATLPAAQGRLDTVTAAAVSPEHDHVIAGDTAGHIRVWDLRAGVEVRTMQACRDSFKQRAHWLAHNSGINGLSVVPERNIIVAASKDANASLWDFDGCLIGILGDHSWQLERRKTWQDPRGERRRPPLAETANLYLAEAGAEGGGGDGAGGGGEGGSGGGPPPDVDEVMRDYSAIQRAALKLEDKRARAREAERQPPRGTHSLLKVHGLQEVPASARELLGPDARGSRIRPAPAGAGAAGGGGGGTGGSTVGSLSGQAAGAGRGAAAQPSGMSLIMGARLTALRPGQGMDR
ncbi:hypothetical protein GPECTOR_13g675 [Gonium pectorale]|uniref:EF-hand domain-containing protein n=1 Tax=Gonium pectorale TaxID=33097 RepID=A0A150GN34_GONPE|nr:hypothetical protein GPECTOR_13g675 [Gonium pectorale]|eukprot:KXZ51188.1 hypothetical protein GPECTOR_13g675 [Gonium pectorale]